MTHPVDAGIEDEAAPTAGGSDPPRRPWRAYFEASLGFRNHWYPAFFSGQLSEGECRGQVMLGERILFKRIDGRVYAIEDRCPHRGARLSLGWNLGDRLACWYHGVEVGGDGAVRKVPAVNNCPLEGQRAVKSYPVKEIRGAIFVYFGDALHPEPCPLELPEELTSPQFGAILCFA